MLNLAALRFRREASIGAAFDLIERCGDGTFGATAFVFARGAAGLDNPCLSASSFT